jgi:hypothetical protein
LTGGGQTAVKPVKRSGPHNLLSDRSRQRSNRGQTVVKPGAQPTGHAHLRDDDAIRRLKKRKLLLRDRIHALQAAVDEAGEPND